MGAIIIAPRGGTVNYCYSATTPNYDVDEQNKARDFPTYLYKYIKVSLSREKTVKLYSKLSNLIATTTTHGRGHALHNKIKCRVSSNLDD